MSSSKTFVIVLIVSVLFEENGAKLLENKTNGNIPEKIMNKMSIGASLMFMDELKQTLEKYLLGICPQNYKIAISTKVKNITTPTCDLDVEQNDLAGRLASLALRAHAATRDDCSRFGVALANTFGELARTVANKQSSNASNEANKKRKLSKSQKAKIAAKQRTALAVKKKAAAVAAATAAKMATTTH